MRLVLYIEMFGDWADPSVRRRLVDLYEVHDVKNREPIGQSLFRWSEQGDCFEQAAEPRLFAQTGADVPGRAATLANLAETGRTSSTDVTQAVADYRATATQPGR